MSIAFSAVRVSLGCVIRRFRANPWPQLAELSFAFPCHVSDLEVRAIEMCGHAFILPPLPGPLRRLCHAAEALDQASKLQHDLELAGQEQQRLKSKSEEWEKRSP